MPGDGQYGARRIGVKDLGIGRRLALGIKDANFRARPRRLLSATRIFPSATVQAEMSSRIGSPPATGMPAAIGFADSRRW